MIENKVLIVHDYPIAKNEGGPRGYYNKCIYLNEPDNIVALNDVLKVTKEISFKQKIKIRIDSLKSKWRKTNYRNKYLANKFIKIPKYKFLYFHDIYSFNDVKHLISKDQIVVFQPHAPELPSIEELKTGISQKKYKAIVEIEKAVFNRANYIVLPNKNCLSIYNAVLTLKHKVLYLRTGIKAISNTSKMPIDNDKINLFYIGRRNEIKGFTLLLNSFKEASKKRNDIRLFIAGGGESVSNSNIVDIGFTNHAYDWISSMDYVISPNASSYFDLNVLEIIAIGTPLIMPTTDGHTYFENKKGIVSITPDTFTNVLLDENLVNKHYKKEIQKDLFDLYIYKLSSTVYKANLETLCKTIIADNS